MSVETLVPPPLLVWGIFPRLLGVVYFISLASLYRRPTTMVEQRRTGRRWRRHTVGVHLVAARADATVFTRWLNGSEVFHWDDVRVEPAEQSEADEVLAA